ncbi:GlxA family transcriptional regulator [Jiangella ureilytica]|uniref:GlxA family transcriptional regulator n=1 Tax=Jiangella ureilytica TaxID=2530374 RepID=A0A4R4S769_9ACTN|nr:GlxA family transcriptional regulator [Jiangella ureilytica]TDC57003.1 GlxA family transcriptional regulator [Jiangella ureilytica]
MDGRSVVVVGYADTELLDLACVTATLGMANALGSGAPYQVTVVSADGEPITCSSGLTFQRRSPGLTVASQRSLQGTRGPLDTLIVVGGVGSGRAANDPHIVGHVRRLARESRRIASVCTGAFVLAAAGLLDGRRGTTHWAVAQDLATHFPTVAVDPDPIYIRDGHIATAAGVTSALDLMLAFIEEDHGLDLARQVARALVTYLQRPGNQAQISMYTAAPRTENELARKIEQHVTTHLDSDLTAAALARVAGVSTRHLTRIFLANLGVTPARFVRNARTEAAAHLLATTSLPITRVAARCGFGSTEALRQAFVNRYGTTPSHHRSLNLGRARTMTPVSPSGVSGSLQVM